LNSVESENEALIYPSSTRPTCIELTIPGGAKSAVMAAMRQCGDDVTILSSCVPQKSGLIMAAKRWADMVHLRSRGACHRAARWVDPFAGTAAETRRLFDFSRGHVMRHPRREWLASRNSRGAVTHHQRLARKKGEPRIGLAQRDLKHFGGDHTMNDERIVVHSGLKI
jgi:hypothetical protein